MLSRFNNFLYKNFRSFLGFFPFIYKYFKNSKTARILLIIVVIKFSIFYGFFKRYYFPKYLKPKWESEQHRIEDVTNRIINTNKKTEND